MPISHFMANSQSFLNSHKIAVPHQNRVNYLTNSVQWLLPFTGTQIDDFIASKYG